MKRAVWIIIALLTFALLIQNTCPRGFAGKTSVTASCGNFPLKHGFIPPSDGQKNLVSGSSPVHFPLYVIDLPQTVSVFRFEPAKSVRPVFTDNYRDALPDELLHPPRA